MTYKILHDIVSAYISNILSPQASPLCTSLFLSIKHLSIPQKSHASPG